MQFESIFEGALDKVLCRAAFFAETHSIKGLLALDRLKSLDGLDAEFIQEALNWNQVFSAPIIKSSYSESLQLEQTLDDKRLRYLIEGAVFPMAYLAGTEWVSRFGFKHLVDNFKDVAIERTGYLGHSWTIWCSFLEIEPYLETKEQQKYAAERFVEFCASQLSEPDWTPTYEINHELEKLAVAEEQVVTAILTKPGFYGHRMITLSYLFKYRNLLSDEQWAHCLKRMYDESIKTVGSPAHDLEVMIPNKSDDISKETIDEAIVNYVKSAAEEVHTLTLADAALELWNHIGIGQRHHLKSLLEVYGNWKPVRTKSGERKD